jgi:hypothetical protein
MRRTLSALFVALFINAVGGFVPMAEARMNLTGTYAFTTSRSCTVANNPFTLDGSGEPTVIPTGPTFRQNSADSGTTTYHADGTGVATGRSATMNISNTAIGTSILSISEFSFPFTYTITAGYTLETQLGQVTFATILGSGTGNTGTVSPSSRRSHIGNGGNTIVSAPRTEIEQETLVFNSGAFTQYRICTRSTTSVRQ